MDCIRCMVCNPHPVRKNLNLYHALHTLYDNHTPTHAVHVHTIVSASLFVYTIWEGGHLLLGLA